VPTKKNSVGNNWSPKSFVQWEPTAVQLKSIKESNPDVQAFADVMGAACEDGYKFTIQYDDYSKGFAAMMTKKVDTGDNAGLILSVRGSTPMKALKRLLWTHNYFKDHIWPTPEHSKQNLEFDD